MKTLVTGGAGFIGSHLVETLLNLGHHVVILDNLSTGSRGNIQRLQCVPQLALVEGSILDERTLGPLVKEADLIFHLAAAVGVKLVVEHLADTLETNVRGTENVIKLAQKYGNTKVILASTSEVYGKNPDVPWKEDGDVSLGPTSLGRWGYACSKLMDEFLALAYHKEQGLPVTVLRLFNTVGARQSARYGMVIPRFVSQGLAGEPITVYGDGTQSRCFAHVGDVVKAMADIAEMPAAEGQVFNVGNDQEVTINTLASLVKETLESSSPIVHVPYENVLGPDFEDTPRRVPDISKIKRYIDYRPSTDLSLVIEEVAQDMQDTDNANCFGVNR